MKCIDVLFSPVIDIPNNSSSTMSASEEYGYTGSVENIILLPVISLLLHL